MNKPLLLVLSMLLLLAICMPAGWILDTHMPFAFVVAGIGIISFFGLYEMNLPAEPRSDDKESALRFAIAGAIVIEYLVIVALTAFFRDGLETMPMITQAMLSNFTTVVGVVIASYFGSSAYLSASRDKRKASRSDEEANNGE